MFWLTTFHRVFLKKEMNHAIVFIFFVTNGRTRNVQQVTTPDLFDLYEYPDCVVPIFGHLYPAGFETTEKGGKSD